MHSCVKSALLWLPLASQIVQVFCFSDPKCLLGFSRSKNPVNMSWLMPLKLMAGLLIDQLTSPTDSGAWGVAIVGNSIFPHHAEPLGFLRALPPTKSILGGCSSVGNIFLPITWLPLPPINYFQEDVYPWEMHYSLRSSHFPLASRVPSHQLFPVGCLTMENPPPR